MMTDTSRSLGKGAKAPLKGAKPAAAVPTAAAVKIEVPAPPALNVGEEAFSPLKDSQRRDEQACCISLVSEHVHHNWMR